MTVAWWFLGSGDDDTSDSLRRQRYTAAHTTDSTIAHGDVSHHDVSLADRIRTGDTAAFRTLFDDYYDRLVRFAAAHLIAKDIAHDVVDDVFLALWRDRAAWYPRTINVYLYTAVRNRALNANRTGRRELSLGTFDETQWSEPFTDPATRADTTIELNERAALLRAALDEMPPLRRAVALLRWDGGLSHAEIAESLGISIGAAHVHVSRALATLKARFRDELL